MLTPGVVQISAAPKDHCSSSCRKSRLHDEKGNRVSILQLHELLLAGLLKGSQALTGKPYLPWVPFAVIRRLARILNKNSCVLEFGSGRSTIWFAQRSHLVVSIEDCLPWYEKMSELFRKLDLRNVDHRFLAGDQYSTASDLTDESFDLVVIDGSYRSKCVEYTHTKLKHDGYLYLDNSDTDMTIPNGDMRLAELKMKQLAEEWSSPLEFFTGFPPGNLHPHQGALLRKS
jgi:predicted O-methyltransferase YrrM